MKDLGWRVQIPKLVELFVGIPTFDSQKRNKRAQEILKEKTLWCLFQGGR